MKIKSRRTFIYSPKDIQNIKSKYSRTIRWYCHHHHQNEWILICVVAVGRFLANISRQITAVNKQIKFHRILQWWRTKFWPQITRIYYYYYVCFLICWLSPLFILSIPFHFKALNRYRLCVLSSVPIQTSSNIITTTVTIKLKIQNKTNSQQCHSKFIENMIYAKNKFRPNLLRLLVLLFRSLMIEYKKKKKRRIKILEQKFDITTEDTPLLSRVCDAFLTHHSALKMFALWIANAWESFFSFLFSFVRA